MWWWILLGAMYAFAFAAFAWAQVERGRSEREWAALRLSAVRWLREGRR
jgi:hypothetical protein